jgi:hypothetical protein
VHQPAGLQRSQAFVDAVDVAAGVTHAALQDIPVFTGWRGGEVGPEAVGERRLGLTDLAQRRNEQICGYGHHDSFGCFGKK